MKTILATNADFETATHWGAPYLEEVIKYAQKKFKVIELHQQEDIKKIFIDEINKQNPILIIGIGHGNNTVYTGYQFNVLMIKGDSDTKKIAKGRHFVLLSCLIGRELLPWLVQNGAVAAQGYKEEFIFMVDQNNYPDSIAKYFFDAHFAGDKALIDGKTEKEAYDIVIKTFDKYINDPNVPQVIKPYLLHDKEARVLFGDGNAKITEGVPTYEWDAVLEKKETEKFNIKNVVKNKDNEPIANATVTIGLENEQPTQLTTDENGIAILENAVPGTYVRKIEHPDYKPYSDKKQFP